MPVDLHAHLPPSRAENRLSAREMEIRPRTLLHDNPGYALFNEHLGLKVGAVGA